MTTLPTCPREDCTASVDHYHGTAPEDRVRACWLLLGQKCDHGDGYPPCYAPRTPQPQPAAVVLPTVDEAARVIPEAWANPSSVGSVYLIAAQAVLDLVAARLPVWQPVEPGAVIKAGTVTRIEWDDRDAREEVTRADYTPCQTDPARFYVDPRTVPAEPEDPRVAVVVDYFGTSDENARDLLARLDAVRSTTPDTTKATR